MKEQKLIELLSECKTDTQARKAIKAAGYRIIRETTNDMPDKSFSVWLTDTLRVYKRYKRKEYILQHWKKIKYEYSGIPTFFATNSYF